MGLATHHMVMYHLRSLTSILPNVANFHIYAGQWSLDPHVNNYVDAKRHFEAVYNGSAASDKKLTANDIYTTYREYGRVLNLLGYYDEAIEMYEKLLDSNPEDFGIAFLLRDSLFALRASDQSKDQTDEKDCLAIDEKHQKYLDKTNRLAQRIKEHVRNDYKGFIPSIDAKSTPWQPTRFDHLLTTEEFEVFVAKRQPFVISLGSVSNIGEKSSSSLLVPEIAALS